MYCVWFAPPNYNATFDDLTCRLSVPSGVQSAVENSTDYRLDGVMIPQSRPLPTSLLGRYHDGTCYELVHTWHPSCTYCFLDAFYNVFFGAVKVYGPLYLISDVLLRKRSIRAMLSQTLLNILRSSLFLAANASCFIGFLCTLRHLIGRFYYPWASYVPAVLGSICGILVERKSRRGLLTGYMLTLAVETVYRMLKYRGYVNPIPYGEVMLYSAASAVLLPAYRNFRSREGLHDAIGGLLSVLFHPRYPKKVTQLVDNIIQGPVTMWQYTGYIVAKIALLSMWCYVVGYMVQAALGLVSSGTKTFKQRRRLKRVLFNWYNVRFGAFLAAHIGGFKVQVAVNVLETLLIMLPVRHSVRMMIAGLLAGVSMVTIRSSSISLYAAIKALEVVYFKAVKKGWARSYYYGDVVMYALSAALLLHTTAFEAHNMRRSFWQFMLIATGGRTGQLNWDEIDRFGTQASKRPREILQASSDHNEDT